MASASSSSDAAQSRFLPKTRGLGRGIRGRSRLSGRQPIRGTLAYIRRQRALDGGFVDQFDLQWATELVRGDVRFDRMRDAYALEEVLSMVSTEVGFIIIQFLNFQFLGFIYGL